MSITDSDSRPKARPNVLTAFRSAKNGRYYWHLKSFNGNVIADCAEGDGYSRKAEARRMGYRVCSGDVPWVEK